ncbi:MAG: GNAT family N-acetyltransferase, partial [Terriglobia bacterium]
MTEFFQPISQASELDLPRLFEVWESSVRATHSFLTQTDIQMLVPLVKQVLAGFSPIYCLRNAEGKVIAFLGVTESKIEMLFVHADYRGAGAGRTLAYYAIQQLGADRVDVNEQNETGVGFYKHLGFRPIGRSA